MKAIEFLQKIFPWIVGLPFAPKIVVSIIIVSITVLVLILIWMPIKPKDNLNLELVDMLVAEEPYSGTAHQNAVVDIKLKNISSDTAFLKRIEFRIEDQRELGHISHYRAASSGKYHIILDHENHAPISHVIEPGGWERFVVVLALSQSKKHVSTVYRLKPIIHYDKDKSLDGPSFDVALSGSFHFEKQATIQFGDASTVEFKSNLNSWRDVRTNPKSKVEQEWLKFKQNQATNEK